MQSDRFVKSLQLNTMHVSSANGIQFQCEGEIQFQLERKIQLQREVKKKYPIDVLSRKNIIDKLN